MRHVFSTALVAVIVSLLTLSVAGALAQSEPSVERSEPTVERTVEPAGINADRVDGKHAVGFTNKRNARRNKLVATDRTGYLPANIVRPLWNLIQRKPSAFADGRIAWDEVTDKPGILGDGQINWGEVASKPAAFADGQISWGEVVGKPADLVGGQVAWVDILEKPADLADGVVGWGELRNKPADLADGVVGWGELRNKPADLADGVVGWGELRNKPAGFADGVDDKGLTGIDIRQVRGSTTLAAGNLGGLTITCPDGYVVIGGGFSAPYVIKVQESYPSAATRWRVVGQNTLASPAILTAYAMCMATSPAGGITVVQ